MTLRRTGSSTQDEIRNRHHWMDELMDGWMRGGGINRGSITSLTLSTEAVLCTEVQLLFSIILVTGIITMEMKVVDAARGPTDCGSD